MRLELKTKLAISALSHHKEAYALQCISELHNHNALDRTKHFFNLAWFAACYLNTRQPGDKSALLYFKQHVLSGIKAVLAKSCNQDGSSSVDAGRSADDISQLLVTAETFIAIGVRECAWSYIVELLHVSDGGTGRLSPPMIQLIAVTSGHLIHRIQRRLASKDYDGAIAACRQAIQHVYEPLLAHIHHVSVAAGEAGAGGDAGGAVVAWHYVSCVLLEAYVHCFGRRDYRGSMAEAALARVREQRHWWERGGEGQAKSPWSKAQCGWCRCVYVCIQLTCLLWREGNPYVTKQPSVEEDVRAALQDIRDMIEWLEALLQKPNHTLVPAQWLTPVELYLHTIDAYTVGLANCPHKNDVKKEPVRTIVDFGTLQAKKVAALMRHHTFSLSVHRLAWRIIVHGIQVSFVLYPTAPVTLELLQEACQVLTRWQTQLPPCTKDKGLDEAAFLFYLCCGMDLRAYTLWAAVECGVVDRPFVRQARNSLLKSVSELSQLRPTCGLPQPDGGGAPGQTDLAGPEMLFYLSSLCMADGALLSHLLPPNVPERSPPNIPSVLSHPLWQSLYRTLLLIDPHPATAIRQTLDDAHRAMGSRSPLEGCASMEQRIPWNELEPFSVTANMGMAHGRFAAGLVLAQCEVLLAEALAGRSLSLDVPDRPSPGSGSPAADTAASQTHGGGSLYRSGDDLSAFYHWLYSNGKALLQTNLKDANGSRYRDVIGPYINALTRVFIGKKRFETIIVSAKQLAQEFSNDRHELLATIVEHTHLQTSEQTEHTPVALKACQEEHAAARERLDAARHALIASPSFAILERIGSHHLPSPLKNLAPARHTPETRKDGSHQPAAETNAAMAPVPDPEASAASSRTGVKRPLEPDREREGADGGGEVVRYGSEGEGEVGAAGRGGNGVGGRGIGAMLASVPVYSKGEGWIAKKRSRGEGEGGV
ncbi:unnamed protein product [Vitrella brassicaformis CCMP3155]|uniref:Uncharacterized protein n=3 Tax=Vitrella brassicaformis TaxID=1169539 RepID=A0A0G4GRW2_VITBC|nr:unnamed protein product [Vitrella brassicaformis CCMP3155]|eukprot:CEM33354.1 unnamed protein product [Vitrella brassicaformis CCMP3155]